MRLQAGKCERSSTFRLPNPKRAVYTDSCQLAAFEIVAQSPHMWRIYGAFYFFIN